MWPQLLGLASGGQVIKRWARRRLHLPDDQGTAAFDYPHHKVRILLLGLVTWAA